MIGGHFQLDERSLAFVEDLGRCIPGGFFIYRAEDGGLVFANEAVYRIFGCESLEAFRELTGFTFQGMVHPDDYAGVVDAIATQMGQGDHDLDYVEYRIVRKDGELRWLNHHAHYAETQAYGDVLYAIISDITDKRDEVQSGFAVRGAVIDALVNNYNTVWLINDVETEACSLYHTDMDATHEEAIRNALSHARYTDTKVQYVDTMVAAEDRERMQEQIGLPYILKQFEERDQFSVSFVRALDTGPRHWRVDFGKVRMPEGRTGVTMGFKDVHDEVMQEQERERHRKELDSMITAMASDYRSVYHLDLDSDDAVCYRPDPGDPDQTPEGVHFPFHARFTEYCDLYVDERYREGFLEFIDEENIRASLQTERIIAYRYLARRGDVEYYEMLRMGGVRHPGEREDGIVHAAGVGFTIIDAEMRESMARGQALKDALNAAEQANKAKTAFLSNMSHEIRTPMNAIIGLNNIALNEPDVPEKVAEYLMKIGASAQHLLGIINDILDMSRIESGRMAIKHEEFSFAKELEQVNTIISGQCRDKGLAYECRTVGVIDDYFVGDAMKLKQVMINILGNSVKFTPEGGSVTFTIEEISRFDRKATLRLTMADTGIGMSSEYLPRLFEAFSQEDSSSTSRYGSTGLGMPITKSIVELMNGHIDVESEKGVGSTFTVTVTLGESDRKKTTMADEDLNPHELSVLVIDDDPIACEHAQIVLAQVGITCEVCHSGSEALDLVRLRHGRSDDYDLLLVDWKMPDMDGVETSRQIRSIVGHDMPIIILTSYSWDDVADEAVDAGVDTFVSKPLFAGSVMDEFREAFRKKDELLNAKRIDLQGKRVLLAEDVAINAEIIVMLLGMRGVEVDLAENGRIAVEMFASHPSGYYDAVLMDMRMPEMDGLEATRVIRASDREDAAIIPIIALTANAFDEDVQRSMQAGLNAHLSKPVEPDILFETLEKLLAN